jgi:hypothetical protein
MLSVCLGYYALPIFFDIEKATELRVLMVLSLFMPLLFLYDFPRYIRDLKKKSGDTNTVIAVLSMGSLLSVLCLILSMLFYFDILPSEQMPWLYPLTVLLIAWLVSFCNSLLAKEDANIKKNIDKVGNDKSVLHATIVGCTVIVIIIFWDPITNLIPQRLVIAFVTFIGIIPVVKIFTSILAPMRSFLRVYYKLGKG